MRFLLSKFTFGKIRVHIDIQKSKLIKAKNRFALEIRFALRQSSFMFASEVFHKN